MPGVLDNLGLSGYGPDDEGGPDGEMEDENNYADPSMESVESKLSDSETYERKKAEAETSPESAAEDLEEDTRTHEAKESYYMHFGKEAYSMDESQDVVDVHLRITRDGDKEWKHEGFDEKDGKVVISRSTEEGQEVRHERVWDLVNLNEDELLPDNPEEEESFVKKFDALPQEQREQVAWGFRNMGYKAKAIKDGWFAKTGDWLSEKVGKDNAVGGFLSRLSDHYSDKAENAEKSMQDVNKAREESLSDRDSMWGKASLAWDKAKNMAKDKGRLAIEGMKYLRWVADPVRGGLIYGAMGASTASGIAKEQRLQTVQQQERKPAEDVTEEDVMEAMEDAKELYKEAGKKVDADMPEDEDFFEHLDKVAGNLPSREDLQNAYEQKLPEELLERLEERVGDDLFEEGILSGAVSSVAQKHIEKSVQRWANQIKEIENNPDLSRNQKERKKEEVVHKFSRSQSLKDFNRMLSDSGKIDALAYGLRSGERVGQAAVGALVLDGFMKMADQGYDYLFSEEVNETGNGGGDVNKAGNGQESITGGGGGSVADTSEASVDDTSAAQADTTDKASIAGGAAPDSTTAADPDSLSQDADIAGGTSPEDSTTAEPDSLSQDADIPGGSASHSIDGFDWGALGLPDDPNATQQDLIESTFDEEWWEKPDQLSSSQQEFIDKIFSNNPPEGWQYLMEGDLDAAQSSLSAEQKQAIETAFADDWWTNPDERTDTQKEFVEEFFSDTQADNQPGEGIAGGVVNQEITVDTVDEGEGLWSSAKDMVEAGDITEDQFNEAWSNEKSTVMIDGEPTHISKVDLVHEGDNLVFVPGEGDNPPHFELDSSSGYEPGTDLPGESEAAGQLEEEPTDADQATGEEGVADTAGEVYGDSEGMVPLDTEAGKAPGIPNLVADTEAEMFTEIDELIEGAEDNRAVFQDDDYVYGVAQIQAYPNISDDTGKTHEIVAEMLNQYLKNHDISGHDPEALIDVAESQDAPGPGEWSMIKIPKDELQIPESQLAAEKVDSAAFEEIETPTLEEQIAETPNSVDAEQAPEPPSDETSQTTTDSSGGPITGEGRGAQVEQPDNQSGQEVVGEGRGAETVPEQSSEGPQSSQETAGQNTQQAAEAAPDQSPATTQTETEATTESGADQANESIEVDTGEQAIGVSTEQVNNLEIANGVESPQQYVGEQLTPMGPTIAGEYPQLQELSPQEWENITDTFRSAPSFSDGVDRLIENGNTDQVETLSHLIEANQQDIIDTGSEVDVEELEQMQEYINQEYEQVMNNQMPEFEAGDAVDEPETVNPGYDMGNIPELSAQITSEDQLLQAARQEFAPGEVFRHNGSAYVFASGDADTLSAASGMAETQARGALSTATGEGTLQGSTVAQRSVSEIPDGSYEATVLMKLPLN